MTNEEMRSLFERLVSTRTDESELAQARMLAEIAERHGAAASVGEVIPGRYNFSASFTGALPGKTIVFEAHGDTVPGNQPYRYDPATGLAYGRGSCDTKGALAAMFAAIVRARKKGGLRGTVRLVSTCREETGGEGARALAAAQARPDMTVVGEPTKLEIVRANKGAWRTRITTVGAAAHSSAPKEGVNAIVLMCEVIRVLESEFSPYLATFGNELLGSPTLSVGTIRGGSVINVVPAECSIEVDWRLIPESRADDILDRLRMRFPAAVIEPYEFYPPFYERDGSEALDRMRRAIEAVTGKPAILAGAPWAANAGILQYEAGYSCVVFGPGDIAQAHTINEYVSWRQVEIAAEIYERFLEG